MITAQRLLPQKFQKMPRARPVEFSCWLLNRIKTKVLQMPRACPVESHVCSYLASNVKPPRPKAVASSNGTKRLCSSDDREVPRPKAVASFPTFEAKLGSNQGAALPGLLELLLNSVFVIRFSAGLVLFICLGQHSFQRAESDIGLFDDAGEQSL